MIIDKEQFKENFLPFDKEIVIEIIDIFINEYDDRMNEIDKNIKEGNLEDLRFNAHSFKGVVANFVAETPKNLAKQLEENAKNGISEGNREIFEQLKETSLSLINDLNDIRPEYE